MQLHVIKKEINLTFYLFLDGDSFISVAWRVEK